MSQKRPFGSLSVAMVTPMHEDGDIDFNSYSKLVEHLIEGGCDALLVSGTTGEAPTTHRPEKRELIRTAVSVAAGRAMVYSGVCTNDTTHAIAMAQDAQEAGAEGMLVCAPYYNRPSQEGLYQHVTKIVASNDLPCMLYDIPGRTGIAFADETLDRLAKIEQIVAVKDATGDPALGTARAERTGLAYYSGDDGLNLSFLANGAVGCVSVVGHVAAPQLRALVDAVDAGELETARQTQAKLRPIINAIMGGGQGAVMAKAAMVETGIIAGNTCRLPLVPASEKELKELREALATL
ncbi:4-hydroxy-tetrahydrodipicolinate synthase [Boudabousia tangfeifanii]|uniref:4-hydroxy-tetrahydrodipicolinate synthase n=1 Tax=Boudabousia tangfeifanii TaxID=1912795 RepID=A0A1D9ML28_9ACTO|nr:4-hydroxy-tetrahydrodipicolinate synthase [Boudabousia tangfeifanii]AOZ72873.1 4-hydroxy-tetrahydrodipicolinate synthase [Boudabousia tangfeifanii]